MGGYNLNKLILNIKMIFLFIFYINKLYYIIYCNNNMIYYIIYI